MRSRCECCRQDLYQFVGGYSTDLARIYFDEMLEDIRDCLIKVRTAGRDRWLYLLADDPDTWVDTETTVRQYWSELLDGCDWWSAKEKVDDYWVLVGYSQGDSVLIGFVGGVEWFKKRFPWLTEEALTELFYDAPIDARVLGPRCEFMFDTIDQYEWDKQKAIQHLLAEHPHLAEWAQRAIPERLSYE